MTACNKLTRMSLLQWSKHGWFPICRDKWLFAARVSPAEQHPGMQEAAAPSHINGDPFEWEPQPVAPFDFEMQDGVFRVFDNAAHTSEPFPVPGNSFDFFSDMSRYKAYALQALSLCRLYTMQSTDGVRLCTMQTIHSVSVSRSVHSSVKHDLLL